MAPENAVAAPAAPLEVAWERNVEGALGPGAPLVSRTVLTMGTRRGDVVLVDLETGALDGSASFGDSVEGGVVLADDGRRLFVPLAKGRHGLLAHDLVAGRRLWEAEIGPVAVPPALVGTTVVAAGLDGTASGLNATTGREAWTHRPDTTASFRAGPLAVDRDVLLADDRGRVERLDARTGAVRWQASAGAPVYNAPALTREHVVVPTTRGTVVALDLETGDAAWTLDLGADVRFGAPLATGDLVVVGTSEGGVFALDAATGAERWRADLEGVISARPAAGVGVVYVGTMATRLAALDLETGRVEWETDLRGRIKTDLAVAGDLLIVATEPRHIVALRSAP